MRIHHVLHTTMMKPYQGNHQDADEDDEQDELFYNVESIVASKRVGRKVKYRVRWEGYTEQDDTWETIENLRNTIQAVRDYHAAHPRAVCDPTV